MNNFKILGTLSKDVQDMLLDGLWQDIKSKLQQAYSEGYRQCREDMLMEAKAILAADKERVPLT